MSLENFPNFFLNFSECGVDGEDEHFYRFKSFRLNVKERQLLKNGEAVSLTPKAFDVLVALVERGGHLVEKNELLNLVWADSFVEEINVARIVHTLRKTLEEDENENKFIETVAKKGYRFVAEVEEVRFEDSVIERRGEKRIEKRGDLEQQESTKTEKIDNESPRRRVAASPRLILFAVGFLSAVFLILLLSFNFQSRFFTDPSNPKSIAVLPLKPINSANRDELYEIGIADSLIHRLSAMKGFVVRPLSATRKYTDIELNPIAAGREQQVDYVIASNYQIADGKIRITAQFFNVATGEIEETYKSEKDTGNIFAMQDAIAGEIGNKLTTKFSTVSDNLTAKRGTSNEEAYRLYLQAMFLIDKRIAKDAEKAVELMEQAVRLDPNYAQAWAGKAHAHLANHQGRKTDLAEMRRKTMEAIDRALALDANLADAHSALCEIKFSYEYDFAGAETACRRAVELNPDSALAHQIYNRFLNSRGRFDEAIAEIKTAIDLEPASLFNQRLLGNSLQYARRFDEAVAQFKRVAEMDENFGTTYMWLSQTLGFQGKEAEAFEVWMKALELSETDEKTIRTFQTAFQTQGWQGVIRVRAERFEAGNEIYFHGAAYNAMIGNKEKTFEYLEKSFQRREWGMAYLEVDPRFDNVRGDARFLDFINER